jgi:hypothetical protein
MWAKWLVPGPTASLLATATAAATLALAAVVGVWRRRVRMPDYLEVGLLLLLVPVLSPQGWDYVLLLGTPAFVLLVDRWGDVSVGWRIAIAAALATTSLTVFDLVGRALYGRILASSVETVAVLVLAVALGQIRRRALA